VAIASFEFLLTADSGVLANVIAFWICQRWNGDE
jgi:hypothetical protein